MPPKTIEPVPVNPKNRRHCAPGSPGLRIELMLAVVLLAMAATAGAGSRSPVRPRVPPASAIAGEMLTVHNAFRADVNLPPLRWSAELASYSQKWANTLVARNRSAHNPNSPYGENILVTGIGASPSMVVKAWASESRNYSYGTNTCSADCGHYTQIVWRQTRRVGCAVARGGRREIWVCSYDPPGNYRSEWPY